MQITDEERNEFEIKLGDEIRKRAEVNTMKVIHDLKNPILAIQEIMDDKDDDKY